MALQKQYNISIYGQTLTFDEAYIQIVKVTGDKNLVTIDIGIYDDTNKNHLVEYKIYQFVPSQNDNAERWDKQGYEYLKTLDEYADAIDV